MNFRSVFGSCFASAAVLVFGCKLFAQVLLPVDVGTTVNGFQDDFDGSALGPNWLVSGANVYSVGGGALHVSSATGDPNHLLYAVAGYDGTVQEVLARIRVTSFGTGDGVRGGPAVGVDPGSSQGINYHFRNASDGLAGAHMSFLNDFLAWGPTQNFTWQANTWYWIRLRQEPNASSQGGANDVFAKTWPGDGSAAEPAAWQLVWDYTPALATRTGYAGIAASTSGGLFQFDVDYILIKAAGFPNIVVTPNSFVQTPVSITNQPQSLTVAELAPAAFSVTAVGNPVPTYQWYRGATPIPAATNAAYRIPSTLLSDNGAQFRAVAQNLVSNFTYYATSSVATLTIIADTNPPVLVGAQSLGLGFVQASFTEPIKPSTATNLGNFSIAGLNGPVAISSITLDASQSNILLTVAPMTDGAFYTLTVSHLTDQSAAANVIAPGSSAQFMASAYAFTPIGVPVSGRSQVPTGNGYNITTGGSGLNGTNDQCTFSYQIRTGDFDYAVRLDSLSLADAWSEAGMMVREDLTPGARSASVVATPSISGAFFASRSATNGSVTLAGSFPANYPNTWLRLKRAGTLFSGFGGFDGQNWTALGSANLSLPSSVYFGFVVASQNTNALTTAAFRDLTAVTTSGTNPPPTSESLGQCNRPTSLAISEIMYHPTNSSLEFVEVFNSRAEPQDVSGYRLGGSIQYVFPPGTVIPGGGFLLVGRSPVELENAYGLTGVLGPYTNNLPNDSGTIRLISQGGGVLLDITYGSTWPWPVSADGAGHSLVLARPSCGGDNVLAWAASDSIGGSPGRLDPVTPGPLRNILINEFLAHTDPPDVDYIELYNHSSLPVDISGCILTDEPATNKFVIPAGTFIAAHGFACYTEMQMGFALNAAGETIYFKNAAQTRVLDAVRFEGQQNGVATGRYPDGGRQFYRLATKTPGAPNAPIRVSDIVINEIMYAPVSLDDNDQYVELYNRGPNAVDLGGWAFVSGISFVFPSNTVVQADGYLVVARNTARMLTNYANLNAGNLVGNFSGKLSHRGERLALAMPDTVVGTNKSGVLQTNNILITLNEVTYGIGGRWGRWSDAGGSSLELIDPHADNTLAPNWADSDETQKSPWTLISATGTIDNGNVAADEVQLLLEGPGECLIDNLQVLDAKGNNLVTNSTLESGTAGWTAEGTEKTSGLETSEGYNSTRCYHLRAVEKGDNQVNRVRVPLSRALPAGTTNVTIAAAARWLKGTPEILLRLRGNWLECAGEIPTPPNAGTPGTRNSRWVMNAPPAITDVKHTPSLPAASQPIVVTARVDDPDGVAAVLLKYRLDPATTYSSIAMNDYGTNGDSVAGDGVFSASIPGQPSGTMLAFYVQATDRAGTPAAATFPNDAPARECLVRVGESQPTGNYPVYRVWMTQATLNKWNGNSRLDNSPYDVTFVLGDERVIYNATGRFKGSPYISPGYCGATCGRCGYAIGFPEDDLFLGETEAVIDWPGGHGGETSALQEQMCYWIADRLNLPWSHRYTIRLQVNGVTDEARQTTFEAVVQPAGSFVNEWVPNDSDGELFKIERAFEFNDSDGLIADPEPRLQRYTTTGGVKKREKYRWTWMFRSTDRRNDYSNIFALVDAVNAAAPEPYTSATLGLVDMEEWMGIFATEHIVVNFDAYGHEIGKNMYAYLPPGGKWQLYMFDLDWAMLAAPRYKASYAANSAPLFNAEDPTITRMYAFPPFARAYWRAIQNAVNGPFDPAICNPVIDAKSRALFANGIKWCDGQLLTDASAVKTWFSQRRAYMQSQLATVAAPFAVGSVLVSNNVAIVTGTAPIGVAVISFNGLNCPLVWRSFTGWTAVVPLQPGTNRFSVVGLDPGGQAVPGATDNFSAAFAGTLPSPAGQVVINEIMSSPLVPGAEFVELYNNSSMFTFDLSGWQFHGLGYTFPPGSLIGPNSFLVLAANRAAFATAYGSTNLVFDVFDGKLQADGETLTLIQSGTNGASDLVVAKVRYSSAPPWPPATGAGASLQLIDPQQDDWRAGNWATSSPPSSFTPGLTNSVMTSLPPFPPLWINELQPENLTGITNIAGQRTPWLELYNGGTNVVALDGLYLSTNYATLTNWAFAPGTIINPGEFKLIFADGQPGLSSSNELHAGFALAPGTGSVVLSRLWNGQPQVLDYVDYLELLPNHSYGSFPDGQSFTRLEFFYVTPAGANNGASAPLSVRINEWMAGNTNTIRDPVTGKFNDWFELYNYGTNTVDLAGYFLTDALTNEFKYEIPRGYTIPGHGFLLVWADDKTTNGTPDLHVPFKLSKSGESIGLYGADGTAVDYVIFGPQTDGMSEGRYPDGAPRIGFMPEPTPRTNNVVPNTPPVLLPVTNQVVTLGQMLLVPVSAQDSDFPAQTLTYALGPGAPSGAVMNAFNGILTWRPASAPSTNTFTITVTDSGNPPLSASASFNVFVYLPPQLQGVQVNGNLLTLSWRAAPGQQYQLEYTDDLSTGSWVPAGDSGTGDGALVSFSNDLTASGQRFFRLRILP